MVKEVFKVAGKGPEEIPDKDYVDPTPKAP